MCSYDMFPSMNMTIDLFLLEGTLEPFGHAEKKALRQAKKAEEAFRASKGYAPNTWWGRLKQKFR